MAVGLGTSSALTLGFWPGPREEDEVELTRVLEPFRPVVRSVGEPL